jgi:Uma2 family endonuclease
MEAISEHWISIEEYLRIEASNSIKHEYVDGVLHAMVGTTRRHNDILLNIASRLRAEAAGSQCHVYGADIKLRAASDKMYYPDIVVTCDPNDDDPLIVHHPCLVIEILSPSTTGIDRREKLAAYWRIPDLLSYLVVSQDEYLIERHWRTAACEKWHAQIVSDGSVAIPCPPCELALDDIYANLTPA